MTKGGFYYLATPYTKYPGGTEMAFRKACQIAAKLMDLSVPIFCPISHSHPISCYTKADATDGVFWAKADQELLEAAKALIVVKMNGWENSAGIKIEIDYFRSVNKPILYIDPTNPNDFIRIAMEQNEQSVDLGEAIAPLPEGYSR